MKTTEESLMEFDPISLQQMDNVKLQNRIDTKFMFRENLLPSMLNNMKEHYFVLDINGMRFNHYETLYFDTENFDHYLRHHNRRVNRYKFRARKYVESNLHFFEVKFKSNRGRTVKERIKRPEILPQIKDSSSDLVKSFFVSMMRSFRVKERSISKYCLGVVSLNEKIKKNNFKPALLYLQKLHPYSIVFCH